MRKFLILASSSIVLLVVVVVTMFMFDFCPPQGPWPMPPWCPTGQTTQAYDDIPKVESHSSLSQTRIVNMYDTWGRNYNMGMFETTQAHIESSFDRVQALGAQEVYVHDFDRAVYDGKPDYASTNYSFADEVFANDFRDESIGEKDLEKLVQAAHNRGMKLGIKRNLAFVNIGKFILSGLQGNISGDVQTEYASFNASHSEEWIRDYFQKWQARMLEKARMYQEAGVDSMSISPAFQDPQFIGYETLADGLWKQLIAEVKKVFHGTVVVDFNAYGFVDGHNASEDWAKYTYFSDADRVEVKIYKVLEKYQSDQKDLESDIQHMMSELDAIARKDGIDISVFFAPSSYVNGLYEGPVEFLDIQNEEIKRLEKDYDVQARAYNYFFNAIQDMKNISSVNVANFAWDDAMDPDVKPRISISASFRNKPAEQVVRQWYRGE